VGINGGTSGAWPSRHNWSRLGLRLTRLGRSSRISIETPPRQVARPEILASGPPTSSNCRIGFSVVVLRGRCQGRFVRALRVSRRPTCDGPAPAISWFSRVLPLMCLLIPFLDLARKHTPSLWVIPAYFLGTSPQAGKHSDSDGAWAIRTQSISDTFYH